MKKNIKLIISISLLILILLILTTNSFATDSTIGGIINSGGNFINTGVNSNAVVPTENSIKNTSNLIYNVLFTIGIIVMVVWGMVLGIHFITSSVAEQAEVKKSLFPFIVGCIVIFGGFGIWKIVVTIAQQFT